MGIVSQFFSFVQDGFVAAAKRRRQRLVLVDMMRFGPARLEALGVDVFAVREALAAKPAAAREVVELGCECGLASHA